MANKRKDSSVLEDSRYVWLAGIMKKAGMMVGKTGMMVRKAGMMVRKAGVMEKAHRGQAVRSRLLVISNLYQSTSFPLMRTLRMHP